MKRRDFVTKTAYAGVAVSLLGSYGCKNSEKKEECHLIKLRMKMICFLKCP